MRYRSGTACVAAVLLGGCAPGDGAPAGTAAAATTTDVTCEVLGEAPLPAQVRETSGLARSARAADLFWTHNDAGGEPVLHAVSADGRLVRQVRVAGASLVDWEDIEAAPCGAASCLYVGDIGDNDAARESIAIYRIPEPRGDQASTAPATAFHARYPAGPRDAEALFVDPAGRIHIVTKGRHGPIELYRLPGHGAHGGVATLERVRTLLPRPRDDRDRVTAATATPDGRWVALRTYRSLYLYPAEALAAGGEVQPLHVSLEVLGDAQWESLALAGDGLAWTTSEAESRTDMPRLARLKCVLPDA